MEIKRGEVVICAAPGDYGKPRPGVVVQSNAFNSTHASIVVCLITSDLLDAPLFRVSVQPTESNGLRTVSQVMTDKIVALPRERIRRRAGELNKRDLERVDAALRLWLDLEVL